MKHLLKMVDLSKEEIIDILDLADKLKSDLKKGKHCDVLKNKTVGLIFQKHSTRTRISFETGVYQLGGYGLNLSANDLQISRGESMKDTARAIGRYLDCIMIRANNHNDVEELAEFANVPIINGLTERAHPCQVLADFMTVREFKGKLEGLKMTYIGDGNNMANSLITGGLLVGMDVSIACPVGYEPNEATLEFAKQYDNFTLTTDIYEAAKDADVLFTDVWSSMGQEAEMNQRKKAFKNYQINHELLKVAKPDAIVQHCLPAHKNEEISEAVFEEHADYIFEEAENRLHAQKAVLVKLLSTDKLQ